MVSLYSWAHSDTGKKRAKNEDCFFHDRSEALFMVADGMGGHTGGDVASNLAVKTATHSFFSHVKDGLKKSSALEKAMAEAATTVYQKSIDKPELRGMGTTLSAMVIDQERAFISHIGDTRIYCLRDDELHQLTSDHSLVNEQVQAGIMSAEEARTSSLRNIITRAIGHKSIVSADSFSLPIRLNDVFLLCTDGLNNMLSDTEILQILNTSTTELMAIKLVDAANQNGGDDNITVIILQIK